MKASEILRKLADVIDSQEVAEVGAGDHNRNSLEPVEVDNTDHTEGYVYIAPLQQKLELLKKAAGVESVYDEPCNTCGQIPCACETSEEMEILKRNAGVPVVIQLAGEDNDVFESKK